MPDGIIVVIALAVLAIIVAIVLPMAQRAAEPFINLPTDRETYIQIGQERYNKFSDTNDITKGNFAGATMRYEMDDVNAELQEVSQTSDMKADPSAPTYQDARTTGTRFKVAPPSALLDDARRCEAKKGRDACAALGTEEMRDCGVCIKGGTTYSDPDNEGKHIGGLLVTADDREMAEESGNPPKYIPTLGECPEGYFFATKDACMKEANRLDCKEAGENGGFDGAGRNIEGKSVIDKCAAAPLSGDTTYVFDTKDRSFKMLLRVIPPAGVNTAVSVSSGGKELASGSGAAEFVVTIPGLKEGVPLDVNVTEEAPYVGADGVERRAILLQWEDESGRRKGSFESSLVTVNGVTADDGLFRNLRKFGNYGRSAQIAQPKGTDGARMLLTAPWMWGNLAGSKAVRFGVKVPGTFLGPVYPEDRVAVPRGPLITQKSTMELLRASPCLKADQKPGKYSAACLKALFVGAGGDYLRGKLVGEGLDKLNRMGDGSAETIAGYLTGLYTLATKGKTPQGRKGTLTEINDAAVKMFGFELVSPCEDIMEDEEGNIRLVAKVGSIDADCLDYLWMNTGSDRGRGDEDNSRNTTLANTYVYLWDRFSGLRSNEGSKKEREASPFTACQRSGTLAPKTAKGAINASAVYEASSKGSVAEIQDFYSGIHSKANYWGNWEGGKADHDLALQQCYGIKRNGSTSGPTQCASSSGSCASGLAKAFEPEQGKNLGAVQVSTNFRLSFDVLARGIIGSWASLIHISTGKDYQDLGSRAPGVWFAPGTLNLHVRIGDKTDTNFGFDAVPGIILGRKSNVVVEANGQVLRVLIDGVERQQLRQVNPRYKGPATVYGGSPFYLPARAMITNFCYVALP